MTIGVVLAILGQISGINTVIYYAPKIFLKAGFEKARSAMVATVLVGTTNCIVTMLSLCIIDKATGPEADLAVDAMRERQAIASRSIGRD